MDYSAHTPNKKSNVLPSQTDMNALDYDWTFCDMATALMIGSRTTDSCLNSVTSAPEKLKPSKRAISGFLPRILWDAFGESLPTHRSSWPEKYLAKVIKNYPADRLSRVSQMVRIVEMLQEEVKEYSENCDGVFEIPLLDRLTRYLLHREASKEVSLQAVFMFQLFFDIITIVRRPFERPSDQLRDRILQIRDSLCCEAWRMEQLDAEKKSTYCACKKCTIRYLDSYQEICDGFQGYVILDMIVMYAIDHVSKQFRTVCKLSETWDACLTHLQNFSMFESNPVLTGLTMHHLDTWFSMLGLEVTKLSNKLPLQIKLKSTDVDVTGVQ